MKKKNEGVNRQSRQEQLYNKNLSLLRRILADSITESHVVVHELSWRMLDSIEKSVTTEKSVTCYSLFFWSLNSTMRFTQ